MGLKNLVLYLMFGSCVTADAFYVALRTSVGDAARNYTVVTDVINIISCSRNCRDDDMCEGFVYNETDRVCGLDTGQITTSNKIIGTTFQVKASQGEPCGKRQKLISVDFNGQIISGTFEYFKSKVESGTKLQLVLTKKDNITLSFAINSLFSNDKIVCGQSNVFINTKGHFLSYLLCTTGVVYRVRNSRNPAESPKMTTMTDYVKTDWFGLDNTCQQVTFTDKSKPFITDNMQHMMGSMTVLQKHDTFVQLKYLTYTDMSNENRIQFIHTGKISTYFTGEDIIFDTNSSWVTSTFSFSDRIETMWCPISGNTACVESIDTRDQILFFDDNWEKIFTKNGLGITDIGTLDTLRVLILKGQKISVQFRNKFMEPNIIFVENNDITAIFSTYPINSESNQTYFLWDLISTSGKYESVMLDYLTGKILNFTVGNEDCSWFVDKSIWTSLNRGTEDGTKDAVSDIVSSGYPIRIKSKCINDNENASTVSCVYDGNYINISHSSQLQFSRSAFYPYPNIDNTGLHLNISDNPLWMQFGSHSVKNMWRRLYTLRNPFYKSKAVEIQEDITWFANFN